MSCLGVLVLAIAGSAKALETDKFPRWFSFTGEVRGRMEVYGGSNRVPGSTEWYYLNRVRLNTRFQLAPKAHVFVQFQDSRAPRTDGIAAPPNLVDTGDIRQAYLHVGAPGEAGWYVRLGRQPLAFGGARLLWQSEWGNVGPGFDGIRLTHGSEHTTLTWFAASAVRSTVEEWDKPRTDRQIYGFFGAFRQVLPNTVIEPFALWKHNKVALCEHGTTGHLDLLTSGFRATGRPHPRVDYIADVALQTGHVSRDNARAWAGHWEFGVRPWDTKSGPRLVAEYQRASGDSATGDGSHGSFDQLYPAWKFGTADPIGWSNMQEGVGGVEWTVARNWQLRTTYHHFWLLSLSDSLYSAAGAVLGCNPNATSRRIGGEADIRVTHRFNNHFQLMAGLGHFMAGPYWKQTRGTNRITYPFVMWTYAF